jgi:hypothetical protein
MHSFFTPISFDSETSIVANYKTALYTLPNDGNWHTIYLYLPALPIDMYNKDIEIHLDSLEFDSGAEIDVLNQNKILQCVGDSWMGSSNDWPRLIDFNTYNLVNIAGGGMTCADMDSRYDFDYNGITNTSDITANAVLVSFGVNDYLAGVTTGTFETTLSSLVDKIRAKQSTAKIFLIRVPNNGASTYGQYGTAMANVAAAKTNVVYLNTSSLDASMDWLDAYHLGSNGKQILADFVKTELINNGI